MSYCILLKDTERGPNKLGSLTVEFVAALIADVEFDDDDDGSGSHHHEK